MNTWFEIVNFAYLSEDFAYSAEYIYIFFYMRILESFA